MTEDEVLWRVKGGDNAESGGRRQCGEWRVLVMWKIEGVYHVESGRWKVRASFSLKLKWWWSATILVVGCDRRVGGGRNVMKKIKTKIIHGNLV